MGVELQYVDTLVLPMPPMTVLTESLAVGVNNHRQFLLSVSTLLTLWIHCCATQRPPQWAVSSQHIDIIS